MKKIGSFFIPPRFFTRREEELPLQGRAPDAPVAQNHGDKRNEGYCWGWRSTRTHQPSLSWRRAVLGLPPQPPRNGLGGGGRVCSSRALFLLQLPHHPDTAKAQTKKRKQPVVTSAKTNMVSPPSLSLPPGERGRSGGPSVFPQMPQAAAPAAKKEIVFGGAVGKGDCGTAPLHSQRGCPDTSFAFHIAMADGTCEGSHGRPPRTAGAQTGAGGIFRRADAGGKADGRRGLSLALRKDQ